MKRILVLEGGGAMGLIQLRFLSRLETETGKKISDIFDLIAGTSVGAINGGVLSLGIPATTFYHIFKQEGLKTMFTKRKWSWWGLNGPLYDRKNFDDLWNMMFNNSYKMKDCQTYFMATSVDRVDDMNHYFRSWHEEYSEWKLDYVIKASFAAPYYFGQLVDDKYKRIWFDGGVGIANLPVDSAYVSAMELWPDEEFEITAVGCGYEPKLGRGKSFNLHRNDGLKEQLLDFGNFKTGGIARKQSSQDTANRFSKLASMQNNIIDFRYLNFPTQKGSMDDISEPTKKYLENVGDEYMNIAKNKGWSWRD